MGWGQAEGHRRRGTWGQTNPGKREHGGIGCDQVTTTGHRAPLQVGIQLVRLVHNVMASVSPALGFPREKEGGERFLHY